MKKLSVFVGMLIMLYGVNANAWDGNVLGTIAEIDVITGPGGAPGNFDLRVSLAGYPALCSGGPAWAYLISTEANYNVLAAALMQAKAVGSNVQIYTISQGGYCHIGTVAVL